MQARGTAALLFFAFCAQLQNLAIVQFNELGAWPRHPSGPAIEITVSSQRAYLAAYTAGLIIVDIANPALPKFLGSFQTIGEARDVVVRNDSIAFVAASLSGIYVVDISNPTRPNLLSQLPNYVAGSTNAAYVYRSTEGL